MASDSSIDYFNESQEQEKNSHYLEKAMKLAKIAGSIAVNNTTKKKIIDSVNTLEDMKERELNQAIEYLKFVKLAYEENKRRIKEEVKTQELNIFLKG